MNLKEKNYVNRIVKIKWGFNDYYGMSFLTPDNYNKILDILSEIRADKDMDWDCWSILSRIYRVHAKKYYEIKELIYQKPRKHAQAFIGRKKIREFILNRDNRKCLKCGSTKNLSIDHIHSVYCGGENKISNLQTLCKGCNSSKSTNYKDYR